MRDMDRRRVMRGLSKAELKRTNENIENLRRHGEPHENIVPENLHRIKVRGKIHASLRRPNYAPSAQRPEQFFIIKFLLTRICVSWKAYGIMITM